MKVSENENHLWIPPKLTLSTISWCKVELPKTFDEYYPFDRWNLEQLFREFNTYNDEICKNNLYLEDISLIINPNMIISNSSKVGTNLRYCSIIELNKSNSHKQFINKIFLEVISTFSTAPNEINLPLENIKDQYQNKLNYIMKRYCDLSNTPYTESKFYETYEPVLY